MNENKQAHLNSAHTARAPSKDSKYLIYRKKIRMNTDNREFEFPIRYIITMSDLNHDIMTVSFVNIRIIFRSEKINK